MVFRTTITRTIRLFRAEVGRVTFSKPTAPGCICSRINATNAGYATFVKHKLPSTGKTNTGLDTHKARIILSMNFKAAEDALPFYALPINTLLSVQKATLNDSRNGYCDNRLYFISSKIQCPPPVVSEKLARRSFVYQLSFDWLEKSLNELLDKGVSGDRILRDLWVLKYHHKTISERLQRIKDKGIDNLFPWMVRCSPEILNRYMKISKDTKSILGDKSTQMYLADRLKISIENVDEMCIKLPALKTIRVTKVKNFLDFLINEGYETKEIVSKPRILASSQKTVNQRLKQLHKLGLQNINLNILCRSKKDYVKFYDSLRNSNNNNT